MATVDGYQDSVEAHYQHTCDAKRRAREVKENIAKQSEARDNTLDFVFGKWKYDSPNTKECNTCGEEKALDDFYNAAASPDGKAYMCKGCSRTYNRERYRKKKMADFTVTDTSDLKTCTKCRRILPKTKKHFHIKKKTKDGFDYWCKKCKNEYNNTWRRINDYKYPNQRKKAAEDRFLRDNDSDFLTYALKKALANADKEAFDLVLELRKNSQ